MTNVETARENLRSAERAEENALQDADFDTSNPAYLDAAASVENALQALEEAMAERHERAMGWL